MINKIKKIITLMTRINKELNKNYFDALKIKKTLDLVEKINARYKDKGADEKSLLAALDALEIGLIKYIENSQYKDDPLAYLTWWIKRGVEVYLEIDENGDDPPPK